MLPIAATTRANRIYYCGCEISTWGLQTGLYCKKHTKPCFLSQTDVAYDKRWYPSSTWHFSASVNPLTIKSECCHAFCTCLSTQRWLIFQRQHGWRGVGVVVSGCGSWHSQAVTTTMGSLTAEARMWLIVVELFSVGEQGSEGICRWRERWPHTPGQVECSIWGKFSGFQKKQNKRKTIQQHTSWDLSPDFNSHGYESEVDNTFQVWNKYLDVQSCGTPGLRGGSCSPHPHSSQDHGRGTSLPQHRLTVTILMYGWMPASGRRGRKELTGSLPPQREEGGGPLWFPHQEEVRLLWKGKGPCHWEWGPPVTLLS